MALAAQTHTRSAVLRRKATPERWQRALQRALLAGVQVRQIAGTGQTIVTSASDPGAAYATDGVACDCPAYMLGGDEVCLHRAAYWFALGVLELDGPEDTPPAPATPSLAIMRPQECMWCNGSGRIPDDYHQCYRTCDMCGGSGVRPTPLPAPDGVSDTTSQRLAA